MKKKCMAWLLTAALCSASIAPVYGAEFTSPSAEETEVFTSEEETDVFTQGTEVVSESEEEEETGAELLTEGTMPMNPEIVQKVEEGVWVSEQKMVETEYLEAGAYVQFTPEISGYYTITADNNKGISDGYLYMKNVDGTEETIYGDLTLLKGETYYFGYELYEYEEGLTASFKIVQKPYLVSMEWVEKPKAPLYCGVTTLEVLGHIEGRFSDGKLRLKYSDGTEDICETDGYTRYDKRISNEIIYNGSGDLRPGTYQVVFKIEGEEDGVTLTTDVVVKDPKELPTIKGYGSVTLPVRNTLGYARLVTGKERAYKFSCSIPYLTLIVKEEGEVPLYVEQNGRRLLKPNTVYYISAGGVIEGNPEKVTIKVSKEKVDFSNCIITTPKTAVYTGKSLYPKVSIKYFTGEVLKKGKDYTVSYSGNKSIGTKGRIKITGKGNFTGTITKSFTIVPGGTKIKTAKRSSKGPVSLTWSKAAGAATYVVVRSTDGKKWTTVANTKSLSFTDKKAKKGTKYQYKVRSCRKVSGKNIYGAYSSVKTVK